MFACCMSLFLSSYMSLSTQALRNNKVMDSILTDPVSSAPLPRNQLSTQTPERTDPNLPFCIYRPYR